MVKKNIFLISSIIGTILLAIGSVGDKILIINKSKN